MILMPSTTNTSALDDVRITEFGLLVETTRRLMRIIETSLRDSHGLTEVEFEAMIRMGRSPDHQMSMSDLARQMVLTSGGITRLVDRLVTAGFADRVSCPSDRRVQWAHLTDLGVETITQALETHLADLDEHFFSAMSPDERTTTIKVLDRLRSAGSDR
jgi:DNA-binding MarR family transcriptional regulator